MDFESSTSTIVSGFEKSEWDVVKFALALLTLVEMFKVPFPAPNARCFY